MDAPINSLPKIKFKHKNIQKYNPAIIANATKIINFIIKNDINASPARATTIVVNIIMMI